GVRFYDRMEIKDALAYLRIISNPNDSISLQRIVNKPPRGIGKATMDKVISISNDLSIPLLEAFREAQDRGLLAKTKVRHFIEAYDSFRVHMGKMALHELALKLLEDAGYMMMWQEEASEEATERVENLFEFISAIKDFETANPGAALSDFLDSVALISDLDNYEEKSDRLTLMTLHSAKGLEFKAVFLVGMEEGHFPHSRSADDPEQLEEERRLCYVGMTRAREELYLFSARTRNIYGEARYQVRSRFIDEIDPEHITLLNDEPKPVRKAVFTAPDEVYYSQEDGQPSHNEGPPALP
ncbi:partial ATP-dependent DNA helicase PcrA, partial [Anaerolineae bacterium]